MLTPGPLLTAETKKFILQFVIGLVLNESKWKVKRHLAVVDAREIVKYIPKYSENVRFLQYGKTTS